MKHQTEKSIERISDKIREVSQNRILQEIEKIEKVGGRTEKEEGEAQDLIEVSEISTKELEEFDRKEGQAQEIIDEVSEIIKDFETEKLKVKVRIK